MKLRRVSLRSAELVCGRQVTNVDLTRAEWRSSGLEIWLVDGMVRCVVGDKTTLIPLSNVGSMEPWPVAARNVVTAQDIVDAEIGKIATMAAQKLADDRAASGPEPAKRGPGRPRRQG